MALVSKAFGDIITFTRASTATYFDSAGVLQSAAIDVPRFDYDPDTLAARGLLIEEARTNLQVNSEDFTSVDWTKGGNTTITADTSVSPAGALTADTFGFTAITSGNCQVSYNQTKAASAITYTGSIFVKATAGLFFHFYVDANSTANSGRVIVDATNWTVFSSANFGTFTGTSGTVTSVGNGWYRITCTTTSGTETNIRFNLYWSNSNSSVTFTPSGAEQVFIWGAQLEAGAFPTSYIPTTTTAVTRAADVASVNTLSPWYNATESTLYLEAVPVGVRSVASPIVTIDDGTTSNRIAMTATAANAMQNSTVVSGALSGNTTTPATTYAAGSTYKIAFAVQLDNVQSASGGASGIVDTTALIPSGLTALKFTGQGASSGLNSFWFRRFTYYPRRLSSAELAAITA